MATETYALEVQGVSLQERNSVVMHFESDNVTPNETMNSGLSLINSWITNVESFFLACLPGSYYIDRITARRAHPKPSAVAHQQFDAGGQAGTISGNVIANQVCPSVFLVPPLGVKSGGRIFMPCIDDGSLQSNQYIPAYVTAINAFLGAQTVNFGVSGFHWQQVIYSRKNLTSSHVISWTLSARIGFQKRRRSPV